MRALPVWRTGPCTMCRRRPDTLAQSPSSSQIHGSLDIVLILDRHRGQFGDTVFPRPYSSTVPLGLSSYLPVKTFLPFCTFLAAALSLCAASKPTPPSTFDLEKIDTYLAAEVHQKGRVGLSVAIAQNGKIVLEKGYGKGSGELPVAPDTMFAIGSVSKQFTCACILLLAQEGILSPQDRVSKYYPKVTKADEITLLDLMNHTSGYPDYYPLDFVDRRMQKPIAPDELIQQYAGGKLDFEP